MQRRSGTVVELSIDFFQEFLYYLKPAGISASCYSGKLYKGQSSPKQENTTENLYLVDGAHPSLGNQVEPKRITEGLNTLVKRHSTRKVPTAVVFR